MEENHAFPRLLTQTKAAVFAPRISPVLSSAKVFISAWMAKAAESTMSSWRDCGRASSMKKCTFVITMKLYRPAVHWISTSSSKTASAGTRHLPGGRRRAFTMNPPPC